MTVTRSPRAKARRRLRDLIAAAANGDDQVEYGSVRDPDLRRVILVGNIDDNGTAVPVMRRGRKAYDDRFTIEVRFAAFAHGDDDLADIDDEGERLLELVRGTVAQHPTLDGLAGIVAATVASATGPNPGWLDDNVTGIADGLVTVAVHARVD